MFGICYPYLDAVYHGRRCCETGTEVSVSRRACHSRTGLRPWVSRVVIGNYFFSLFRNVDGGDFHCALCGGDGLNRNLPSMSLVARIACRQRANLSIRSNHLYGRIYLVDAPGKPRRP